MKRTKLFTGLIMCCLCLSLLVVGVWAAATVTFDMNANLQYYPDGVYVALNGQVYVGDSLDDMSPLNGESYTYNAHNFDDTQAEQTGTYPIESWAIGNLSFSPNAKYLKLKVTVTNYSDFEIIGIPTISGGVTTNGNITVTDPGFAFAYVGDVGTYELILELTGTTAISGIDLTVSFNFEQAVADSSAFTYSGSTATLNSGYTTKYNNILIAPSKNSETLITAYSGMNNLKTNSTVIILNGLETVSGFGSSSNLTNIILPNSLKTINAYAFQNCSNLTKIKMPNSLTTLGDYSLMGTNISEIKLSDNITSIGNAALAMTNLKNITIPKSVKSINLNLLKDCESLTSVTIPSSVTSIGTDAFIGCTSLVEITIDSPTIYQQANTADACGGLLASAITVKVNKYIDDASNSYLNSINFKKSVLPEGDYFVYGSPADYSNFTFSGNTITGLSSTYTANAPEVLYIPGKDESGQSLKIAANAFSGTKFQSSQVIILNGLTTIGDSAFANCLQLTSITIPNSVTSVAYGAFVGCNNLDTFNATGTYTTLDNGNLLMKGTEVVAFAPKNNIDYTTMPSTVTSIGDKVFYDAFMNNSILIPSSVESIGYQAFYRSSFNIIEFEAQSSLTSIEREAFVQSNMAEITLPDSLETIGQSAFSGSELNQVTLGGESLIYLDSYVFYNCGSLKHVNLTTTALNGIGPEAFSNCISLEKIVIPYSVTTIGENAFYGCTNLKEVNLALGPNNEYSKIKRIDNDAFAECPALYKVIFNSTLLNDIFSEYEDGNQSVFGGIFTNIQIVQAHVSLTEEGGFCPSAFFVSGAIDTDYITFGYSGRGGYDSWFDIYSGEATLSSDYSSAEPEVLILPGSRMVDLSSIAFTPIDYSSVDFSGLSEQTKTIIILDGAYNYEDLFSQAQYVENVIFLNSMQTLANQLRGTTFKKIVLPENLAVIENYAFESCINLEEVVLPETIQSIGDYAFAGCSSLSKIIIPDTGGDIEVGRGIFEECTSLTEITIQNKYFASLLESNGLEGLFDYAQTITFEKVSDYPSALVTNLKLLMEYNGFRLDTESSFNLVFTKN